MTDYFNCVLLILGYLLCAVVITDIRTSYIHIDWSEEDDPITEGNRELTPLDIWIALFWPVYLAWYLCKMILCGLHMLLGYFLFMFGIRYVKSDRYERINNKLLKE